MLGVLVGCIRAQLQMTRHNLEDLLPLLTSPLFTVVIMAVLLDAGRNDLNGYAIIAPVLVTIGQMGLFVASEMITNEREDQTFELLVATPTPLFLVIASRVALLTSLGLVGFVESWLIARLAFGVSITVHHPWVMLVTLGLTIFAATGTALVAAALICFSRSNRSFQNAVSYPLYVLAGVLVPITFLPVWLQPFSRIVFLYWSANLMRDALQPAAVPDLLSRFAVIASLGAAAFVLGGWLVQRMLLHLKREGTLGLT